MYWTRNKVREGIGASIFWSWESEFWSVSSTLVSHTCILLVSLRYASVQVYKTRESVREGIGPSDGLGLGVKKLTLVSCVLYVVIRY